MPDTVAPARVQVLASPPPIPLDVIIRFLRKKATLSRRVVISPLLAQRIAAELEQR